MQAGARNNPFIRPVSSCLVRAGRTDAPDIGLSPIDRFQSAVHVSQMFVYARAPDPEALRAALARTLAAYPIFSGRLVSLPDGGYLIRCNDEGALFSVSRCLLGMRSFDAVARLSGMAAMFGRSFFPDRVVDQQTPLLAINLTLLADGGAVVSVANSHCTADLPSVNRFLIDLSRVLRGLDCDPPELARTCIDRLRSPQAGVPVEQSGHEGIRLLASQAQQRLAMGLLQGARDLATAVYAFDVQALRAMKSHCLADAAAEDWFSTQDLLAALVWTGCGDAGNAPGRTPLSTIINYREKTGFGIPPGYVGNTLASRVIRDDATPLDAIGRARAIRRAHETVTPQIVGRDLDFLAQAYREGREAMLAFLETQLRHGVSLNNLSALRAYEVDLGTGAPSWYNPPLWPLRRIVHVLPSPPGEHRACLHVCMPADELAALSEHLSRVLPGFEAAHRLGARPGTTVARPTPSSAAP